MDYKDIYQKAVEELTPSHELVNKVKGCKEKKMIKFSKRKVVIVALVACLLIGTTVFAAGQITSYRSWSRANDEIEDYATACEKAVELDIQTKIPEQLSNGYVFESANIGGMEGLDEEGNAVAKGKSFMATYSKEGCPKLSLFIDPLFEEMDNNSYKECKEINGVDVFYNEVTYKFVPPNYELTEEDKQNMEKPDYEISYGSDEVEIMVNTGISFVKGQKGYNMFCWDGDMTTEEWFTIAEELMQ